MGFVDPGVPFRNQDIPINLAELFILGETDEQNRGSGIRVFQAGGEEIAGVERGDKIVLFLRIRTMVHGKRLVETAGSSGVPLCGLDSENITFPKNSGSLELGMDH